MIIRPSSTARGELRVPGDKGISHRAILIGAGVEGTIHAEGLSLAGDVARTLSCMRQLGLGAEILATNSPPEVELAVSKAFVSLKLEGSAGWARLARAAQLDCGNSGTTMRLLMGILAGGAQRIVLAGDPSLSRRPMARVANPLRDMGADVGLSAGGTPPVRLAGGNLRGIDYESPVASAQVKSAVLLAALQAEGSTSYREPSPSRDHTERMLRSFGVDVGRDVLRVEPTQLFGDKSINIPGDFSSASYLLTAAAIAPEGDVTVEGVGVNPTRTAFLDVLRAFGARVDVSKPVEQSGEPRADVRVRTGQRRPPVIEPDAIASCIDELPLVAVLAAVADGETEVRGASELRVKESDRIASIVAGLSGMGADIRALEDGFVVRGPSRLRGASVDSAGDHRIAMALAVAALAAEGETSISGWDSVSISYPGFEHDLSLITSG
ncbi:MAG: 3-phosphoshikimate 1-carboxyvinyltransferase [Actinomycetota bacterium]|nr:3-phosphoshikimate 1-carboxyvinyltransferase [Actinomycetota bacterium]